MEFEAAKKIIDEKLGPLQEAMKILGDQKQLVLKKFVPKEEKEIKINGEPAKTAITEGGLVMIQFVSPEEAQIFYDNL